MTIEPKLAMWINVTVAILAAIVGGAISFSGILPSDISQEIVKYSSFTLSVYSVVNAALHSVSSENSGPIAKLLK